MAALPSSGSRASAVDEDHADALQASVRGAFADASPLRIVGGGTHGDWLPDDARCREAQALSVAGHRGVVHFAPTELVLTARCGTPLGEIDALLAA
jgi:glycolate oxidase FAD binding subunit